MGFLNNGAFWASLFAIHLVLGFILHHRRLKAKAIATILLMGDEFTFAKLFDLCKPFVTLYVTIMQLEADGYIKSQWSANTPNQERHRIYKLSADNREHLMKTLQALD
jgi:hypothetical protein